MRNFLIICFLIGYASLGHPTEYSFYDSQYLFGTKKAISWKTLRDESIVKQELDYSCGAASIATILKYFYNFDTSEREVLKSLNIYANSEIAKSNGYSFSSMKKGVANLGFRAEGYSTSFDQLSKLKIPVIVYLRYRGRNHFSVLTGINENFISLADPSLGNITLSKYDFLRRWESTDNSDFNGKMFVIFPQNNTEKNSNFFNGAVKRNTNFSLKVFKSQNKEIPTPRLEQ